MHARLDDLRNCDHIRRHCIGYREHNRPRVSANGPSKAEFSVFPGWLPVIFQKPPSAGIGVQSFAVATAAVTIGDSRVFLSFFSLFFRDFCFFFSIFLFCLFLRFSWCRCRSSRESVSASRREKRASWIYGWALCAVLYHETFHATSTNDLWVLPDSWPITTEKYRRPKTPWLQRNDEGTKFLSGLTRLYILTLWNYCVSLSDGSKLYCEVFLRRRSKYPALSVNIFLNSGPRRNICCRSKDWLTYLVLLVINIEWIGNVQIVQ